MKTIKIFLASSSELKEDREQFRSFIGVENDRIHKQNVYLHVIQWEYFLDSISDTRMQNEYNLELSTCDIVVCLFFTKVGKYTTEEFNTAYSTFKNTGKPKIWTYFKKEPVDVETITDEINTLLSFKKKIANLGHYYSSYANLDSLKLQFKMQLEKIIPDIFKYNPPVEWESNQPSAKFLAENNNATSKAEILALIEQDIDKAFEKLDNVYLNKDAAYNDLSKEYFQQPNNFSLAAFRSKIKRFVNINWKND